MYLKYILLPKKKSVIQGIFQQRICKMYAKRKKKKKKKKLKKKPKKPVSQKTMKAKERKRIVH